MGSRVDSRQRDQSVRKMAILFAQPYISPLDYATVEFLSMKEMLLVQQSAVNEYERC
jgi:hypothetical protein